MFEHLKNVQRDRIKRSGTYKNENLKEWYRKNPWAKGGSERDFADEDYPGRGLEFEFFEIPN